MWNAHAQHRRRATITRSGAAHAGEQHKMKRCSRSTLDLWEVGARALKKGSLVSFCGKKTRNSSVNSKVKHYQNPLCLNHFGIFHNFPLFSSTMSEWTWVAMMTSSFILDLFASFWSIFGKFKGSPH